MCPDCAGTQGDKGFVLIPEKKEKTLVLNRFVLFWVSALHLLCMSHGQGILGLTFLICKMWSYLYPCRPACPGDPHGCLGVWKGNTWLRLCRPEPWPSSSSGQQGSWAEQSLNWWTMQWSVTVQAWCFLGNLNPLQREGFNWLRLCASFKGASQSRD